MLSGWPGAFAFGLTNNKRVFVVANNVDSAGNIIQTPVVWDHGSPVNLGTLLPNSTAAVGMNNRGEVVGDSFSFDLNVGTPFIWYKGQMKALPLLPGAVGGGARGINDLRLSAHSRGKAYLCPETVHATDCCIEVQMKAKIEVVANVIVILLAIAIGSVYLKDRFSTPAPQPKQKRTKARRSKTSTLNCYYQRAGCRSIKRAAVASSCQPSTRLIRG